MEDHKIKKLIEQSFLSSEQKRFLFQYIELKRVDMKFFDIFSTYLMETAKKNGPSYEKLADKIQNLQKELDERATLEKKRIEDRLEQELSSIDQLDLKTRRRIWEEYYDTLDELGERYDKKLKEILSKIELPAV